jgi:hypothetical protein
MTYHVELQFHIADDVDASLQSAADIEAEIRSWLEDLGADVQTVTVREVQE